MPPPPVTFDLESGVRVTCDINCIWLGLVLLALLRLVGLFAEYLTSSIFGNHCCVFFVFSTGVATFNVKYTVYNYYIILITDITTQNALS